MARNRSNYLIDRLIDNNLSQAEFNEFLAGLHQEDELRAYSDALESYFFRLLEQHEHPPEPEATEPPVLDPTRPES
ncbi:hypothetical protein [Spirosoma koreense]